MDRTVIALQPLYLNRESAAAFLSLSVSQFEAMASRGEAPKPRQLSKGRAAWLVEELIAWGKERPVSNLLPPPNCGYGRAGKRVLLQQGGAA
jgi:predicted DNA-binding transcriptional regulator AlpA